MLVSVLLPVYNGARHLDQALESVFAQSYAEFQICVVDDGSTDETPYLLQHYAQRDARLTWARWEQNQGIVPALNACLEMAQGDMLARHDHDDLMHPQRLEAQVSWAKQREGDFLLGCQIALEPQAAVSEGQAKYLRWQNRLLSPADHFAAIYQEAPLSHPSLFLPAATLKKLGGYHNPPWAEDYDLMLRAYLAGIPLCKLDQVLVTKTLRQGQLTWTDHRYRHNAFYQAKAHFFKQDPRFRGKQRIYLVGSGSAGRQAAHALLAQGVKLEGFLEDREFPPHVTLQGLPIIALNPEFARTWNAESLILFALSDPTGRARLQTLMEALGLQGEVVLWV